MDNVENFSRINDEEQNSEIATKLLLDHAFREGIVCELVTREDDWDGYSNQTVENIYMGFAEKLTYTPPLPRDKKEKRRWIHIILKIACHIENQSTNLISSEDYVQTNDNDGLYEW